MSSEYGIPTAPVKQVETRKRFLHLSSRSIIIAMSILLAIVGMIVLTPVFAMLACLAYILLSLALLATLLYGKGWIKGFAVGFSVPHVLGYLVALNTFNGPEEVLAIFLVVNAVSVVAGLAMAAGRCYFKRRGGTVPVPNVPVLRNWLSND